LVGVSLWFATLFWSVGGAIFRNGSADLLAWKLGLLAIATCFLAIGLFNPDQAPFSYLLLWTWAGLAVGRTAPRERRHPGAVRRVVEAPA
jgi:hypothetical protein